MPEARRGEIWFADLDPTRGHEQAGDRPVLVLSATGYSSGPSDLCVVVPLTTRPRALVWHVPVSAPAGLGRDGWVMCDQIRCIARERLRRRVGCLGPVEMEAVARKVAILLEL
jgi:mRNA interferase MazF